MTSQNLISRILFVCLGNICRSPAAQGVARALMPDVQTDSAGTSGWHVGEPPHKPMVAAAQTRGVDISDLRARLFNTDDFDRFDLIIGMDSDNLAEIEALRPPDNQTPVHLFTDYAPQTGATHVPDPYYTGDFEGVLDLIETAAQGLKDAISGP